jgi:hypothetical protein
VKPQRNAAKARAKKAKRKRHVLAAVHTKHADKPAKPARSEAVGADTRLAAPAAAPAGTSGTSAILFVVSALIAVSLLLIATAAVPPWVLPARVGPTVARHRGDIATAGVTAAICLLFAFLIAWMA